MNYSELVDFLYGCIPSSPSNQSNSSIRTSVLDELLDKPSKNYPIVHVAGTNGKGSIVSKISHAYSLAGYKVGVFTSPHLQCLRERIQINQEKISEEEFLSCGQKIFAIIKKHDLKLIFFEIITCMALEYFSQKKVDLVILETGIGGRLDPTNFITPILSIITSISYDHCSLLGNSLEEIGFQKAGIIKKNVPVVLGPSAQIEVIEKEACEKNASIIRSHYLGGFFDEENSAIAKTALQYLSRCFFITEENILLGLEQRPSCRFEVYTSLNLEGIQENAPEFVIFDVAHNPDGFKKLIEAVRLKLSKKPLQFLLGMSKGKEIKECLEVLKENASYIHLAAVDHFKLLKPSELLEELLSIGFTNCSYKENLEKTLKNALQQAASKGELLIVCGSFYIMKEVKNLL